MKITGIKILNQPRIIRKEKLSDDEFEQTIKDKEKKLVGLIQHRDIKAFDKAMKGRTYIKDYDETKYKKLNRRKI